jgi:hypothetical protein
MNELLPEITITSEFKARLERTCEECHVAYATLVTRLLEEWMNGNIPLNVEPDPDFVASAREAFQTESVQQTLMQLGTRYDPTRTYPHAVPAL